MKIKLLTLFCITSASLFAQSYRSESNPYYWKNKKPYGGYWQQDVLYKIRATLNEKTDIISANEELTYYNNSPDTLYFVYFNLYQNAFQPGSYLDGVSKANGVKPNYVRYELQKKNQEIQSLSCNEKPLRTETDNTIVKAYLETPLLPNDSVHFNIQFTSSFDMGGSSRKRMKVFRTYGYKHYDGVHWYPRICVYDKKFGWNTDQHLEKEFYGDYGTYDVELSFANHYIVEATGELQNEKEMLPDELRQKLDIVNFKDKPLYSPPSVIIPYDSTQRKTWKYYATNVHDFAFTADPTYRIGESSCNVTGVKGKPNHTVRCIAIAQEPVAARWQNSSDYLAKIISINSEDFGAYLYPKIVAADARDGMEYPMLTLDGGFDPTYRDLLTHEVGHNWFFGMIGNNETYRAFMDEGFTQFLTNWTYEKIDGKLRIEEPQKNNYQQRFTKPDYVRNSEVYYSYMIDAIKGEEIFINKHSNDFNTALRHGGGYRHVYYKPAVMLYNLQYVLGEELFLKAMKHYVEQWKIAHPYPEDFRNSIIEATHVDLNWFFDEWIESAKTIDYKIESVKHIKKSEGEYKITFSRKGQMQMPIDFVVTDKLGAEHPFHIPNTWFVKQTQATVLPKWFGWDKIQPTYEATVKIPGGINKVAIDPSLRLADANMRNNKKPYQVSYNFDSRINNLSDWTQYEIFARPDAWYNSFDGIKPGVHLNGNFVNYYHVFDANFWINSGIAQGKIDPAIGTNFFDNVSYRLNYRSSIHKISKNSFVNFSIKHLDGLECYTAGVEKKGKENKNNLYLTLKSMIRRDKADLQYILYPNEWIINSLNNTVNLGYEHHYTYKKGGGKINLDLRSSTLLSDYDYATLKLSVVNRAKLSKFIFCTRTFAQLGTGSFFPKESSLFLAGANPEELMDNKFTRSRGFFPDEWATYGSTSNYLHAGGGLNLRGYAGYLSPDQDQEGNIVVTYKGNSGAAINAELEFDQFFNPFKPSNQSWVKQTFKLNTYLFADMGVINHSNPLNQFILGTLRADAGVGTALTIKKWGPLQKVDPLTIRFDMPFFLNRIPTQETEHLRFRWIIGISRAF
jgi:hypothetical protein